MKAESLAKASLAILAAAGAAAAAELGIIISNITESAADGRAFRGPVIFQTEQQVYGQPPQIQKGVRAGSAPAAAADPCKIH